MTAVFSDELRARVEADFGRVVDLLGRKVALKSISAEGITAEHMKRSAEFVADELRQVGIDAKVVQSRNPDGTPGAWEVIGSKIVDPQAPTVLLYAHHDVQPVPDPSAWDTDPFVATEVGTRLYGRGSADDGGGIAIHSGAMKALGDDLKVNIKVFVEGEEEMGSPSFIPFIEDHRDEFASDVIVVADSGNWSAEIPSLTTSLRGNTCVDVNVKVLHHPVHSGQYGGPILDANTLAAMLIASMYDANGDLAVPGVAAQEPVGGLQRDLDEATVREDAGIVDSYRLAGTGSLASRLWTKPSVTVIASTRIRSRAHSRGQPRDHVPPVPAHRAEPAPAGGAGRACRVPAGTRPRSRRGEGHQVGERHGLGDGPERGRHQGCTRGHGGGVRRGADQQGRGWLDPVHP